MSEIGQGNVHTRRRGFIGTDTALGVDAEGRPIYQFGHRRDDGIWVSPPALIKPQAMFVRRSQSGNTRKPWYLYGDDWETRS